MRSTEVQMALLQEENPYPALNLLESFAVCHLWIEGRQIPERMFEDIVSLFDRKTVETACRRLEELGLVTRIGQECCLNEESYILVLDLLTQMKANMILTFRGEELTAGIFLEKLTDYLKKQVNDLEIMEPLEAASRLLKWKGDVYSIQLACSPVWLPVAAEQAESEKKYTAIFGPFAALSWHKMVQYYEYSEFRDYTAYYDPWYCQKMNISKGGLFAYFDWFLRDVYGKWFQIPDNLKKELQNMGLLRYNDER